MSNPNLLDIEPGGENTQYESIRLYTETPAKQTGQMGGALMIPMPICAQFISNVSDRDVVNSPHTKSEMRTYFDTDNNGQKLSDEDKEEAQRLEGEFTSNMSGQTDKDSKENEAAAKTRSEQGYGPGSGVGA
ncbi:hypothetical protein CNMCM5793_006993 [Aspergillus hiratsukae]|uniref:Uncharacterized protein n=1 Tax=Aspergillus hiratsukae TaxID=1194566 RepID=A0A8H6UD21_9EURO|nr:hypothetical protein CNMCM5793_006993 [Aspergillus hiratsukae]KAF7157513.1 hypothetical protein CNMCM6106_003150 [Aspergillus hiratsukae]